MFSKSSPIFFLLFLSFFSHSAVAATKAQKIEKLLDTSGLKQQIRTFPGMLKAGIREQGAEVSAEEQRILIESAEQTIFSGPLLKSMRQEMNDSLSDSQIDRLIEWMDSELGKKVIQAQNSVFAENDSMDPNPLLPNWLHDERRLRQAAELDRLSGQSETGSEIVLLMIRVMFETMIELYGLDHSEYERFLKNEYQLIKREVVEDTKPAALQAIVLWLGTLSEREIDRYLQWSATPLAQQFYRTHNKAVLTGTSVMFQNWARLVTIEFDRHYDL